MTHYTDEWDFESFLNCFENYTTCPFGKDYLSELQSIQEILDNLLEYLKNDDVSSVDVFHSVSHARDWLTVAIQQAQQDNIAPDSKD